MQACQIPREDDLPGVVHVKLDDRGLDLEKAKKAAKNLAHTYSSEPMLISWYDGKNRIFAPQGECCAEKKPSWIEFARSHGGNLTIDVNHEEYVFIFQGVQHFP